MVRHTGEDFIDVEGITVASVLSFESASVYRAEFDTPEADRFAADGDASLGQKIFNIPVTEIESEVEPDSITDDVGWETVTPISLHSPILAIWAI